MTLMSSPLIFASYWGSLLNFGKRYEADILVIFDRWQKLHLGLDGLSNQKILKGIYYLGSKLDFFSESYYFQVEYVWSSWQL